MTLPYSDELKKMITGVLEETIEGRSLFYQPPEKISFEGVEYQPREFLAEVKKRSLVGEKILQHIHNQTSRGLEEQLQSIENPDEPFFGFINPDGSETYHSISDIVTGMEDQTEFGKEYLLAALKLNVPEMFGFAYSKMKIKELAKADPTLQKIEQNKPKSTRKQKIFWEIPKIHTEFPISLKIKP